MTPIAPATTPCKCCHAPAPLFGVVDFHKNCEDRRQHVLPLSGIPIYYHRCPRCGFLFTTAFDDFTPLDFLTHIYNEPYLLVDPDYLTLRPEENAQRVRALFPASPDLRILDFGGGTGATAQHLRTLGYSNVTTYDPFSADHATLPPGPFDLITCFEVLEHSPTPAAQIAQLLSLLAPPGLVLVSTQFQPQDILTITTAWWYLAPRNGHISLHTKESMTALLLPHHYRLASFDIAHHLLFQNPPPWAEHLFRR